MKNLSVRIALLLFVASFIVPTEAQSQGLKIGPQLGINMDGSALFLGLESHFDIPLMEREVWGNVGFDFYPFIEDETKSSVNVGVLFPFGIGHFEIYGGGGLVVLLESYDLPAGSKRDETDTDIGLNVKAGLLLGSRSAGYRPFIELDQTILGAGSDFHARVGIFMAIGGR